MIFRQLFDGASSTYSYILASRHGGEALIIDPVLEKVERYLKLMEELDLRLVKAVDTHLHADHITGLGALRDRTHCITVSNFPILFASGNPADYDHVIVPGTPKPILLKVRLRIRSKHPFNPEFRFQSLKVTLLEVFPPRQRLHLMELLHGMG